MYRNKRIETTFCSARSGDHKGVNEDVNANQHTYIDSLTKMLDTYVIFYLKFKTVLLAQNNNIITNGILQLFKKIRIEQLKCGFSVLR